MLCAGKRRQASNRTQQQIDTEDREAIEDREDCVEAEDQLATWPEGGSFEEEAAAGNSSHDGITVVDID